jgi:hypothetical protein
VRDKQGINARNIRPPAAAIFTMTSLLELRLGTSDILISSKSYLAFVNLAYLLKSSWEKYTSTNLSMQIAFMIWNSSLHEININSYYRKVRGAEEENQRGAIVLSGRLRLRYGSGGSGGSDALAD